jgi:sterol desaturase/sphingolipid hydroxylase (fatty acid hydroxylase superfamily)
MRIGWGALLTVAAAGAIFVAERRRPRRAAREGLPRLTRNAAMGAASMATMALLQTPTVEPLARHVERRRIGLVQRLPLPPLARDAAAVLLLDYTIYVWHVLTHRVPALWRFHLVHHIDRDLDSTTALRFHAADMAVSVPYRLAQVALIGASPRALRVWQSFFFASVLFHHSNIGLSRRLERLLGLLLTTPEMHAVHHSAVFEDTHANWTSGLSLWDRLHGTLRLGPDPAALTMGVPGYQAARDARLGTALALPFFAHREAFPKSRAVASNGDAHRDA